MKEPTKKAGNKKLLPLACLVISMGFLVAGLWPFNFRQRNGVYRIEGQQGLRFNPYGIAFVKEPIFGKGGVIDISKPFTILLELRPREEPAGSLPRILSAHDADWRELFFLGQWRDELILRILEEERFFHLRYRETGAVGLQKDVKRSIVIRSGTDGLALFVDGAPVKTVRGVDFSLLSDRLGPAWMILGNSPTGESPWRGDLLSLSFFPKALSPEKILSAGSDSPVRYDLVIPSVLRAPAKGLLVPPWRIQEYNRSFWKDVFVNILGFIPFGFAMYAWARKDGERRNATVMGIALLLGAGISLFIELLQVYLPARDSSLTDVLNNILGTYAGARLFRTTHRILMG